MELSSVLVQYEREKSLGGNKQKPKQGIYINLCLNLKVIVYSFAKFKTRAQIKKKKH